jgi:hypothetical protein
MKIADTSDTGKYRLRPSNFLHQLSESVRGVPAGIFAATHFVRF